MPVLSALRASANGATTASGTFVDAATTAPLADGVTYAVWVTAGVINANNDEVVELEVDYGGTQYGFARYSVGFDPPGPGSGSQVATVFLVVGDGSSTVAIRHRLVSGGSTTMLTGHIECVPLSSLTLGTHYWYEETPNSGTLTNPAAGAGWVGTGDQVDVTPAATGRFAIFAAAEVEFTAGNTAADQGRLRVRVTEDPAGTPSAYNLQRNTVNAIEGPETRMSGGGAGYNLAFASRFLDIPTLTAGTTYRFEVEREGVPATANTGYRRERLLVLDLSVWPEWAISRDVDGQSGVDNTFATATTTAPPAARDYLLIGAIGYQQTGTWTRSTFTIDPAGTPSSLPPSQGFGQAMLATGNGVLDDYGLIGLQWDVQAETGAISAALNGVSDISNVRWGNDAGDFPGGVDDGVATTLLILGMETSTTAPGAELGGSAVGGTVTTADPDGVGEIGGTAQGGTVTGAALSAGAALSGGAIGQAVTTADPDGVAEIGGGAVGSAPTSAALSVGAGFASLDAAIAYFGNSFTLFWGNNDEGGLPLNLLHVLSSLVPGHTVTASAPPYLATSIANSNNVSGFYPGMSLGGMTLFPTIDQRTDNAGTTDAIDALASVPNNTYDLIVLTSGMKRDNGSAGTAYELPDGIIPTANVNTWGVNLGIARQVGPLVRAESDGAVAMRLTQEGFNANDDVDLSDMQRIIEVQVRGARQLLAEGVIDHIIPDHWVWGRLLGIIGANPAPITAFAALTHSNSLQPGGRNYAWLQYGEGPAAPFDTNSHQNAIGTIVNAWIHALWMFGIDPRGDTTYSGDPSGLPAPLNNMLNATGTRVYGGQNIDGGVANQNGNLPYDLTENPAGPPDSEMDLDWSLTTQAEIQDVIYQAWVDWEAGTDEFSEPVMSGGAVGAAVTGAALAGVGAVGGSAQGGTATGAQAAGVGEIGGGAQGGTATSADPDGVAELGGGAQGGAATSAALEVPGALGGSAQGGTVTGASLAGVGEIGGGAIGQAVTSLQNNPVAPITGRIATSNTSRPYATAGTSRAFLTQNRGQMGKPWHVNPEDEGQTLTERIVYPEETERNVVTLAAAPVDLTGVAGVSLEVWDEGSTVVGEERAASWLTVAGTGSSSTETGPDSEGVEQTWHVLAFAPDVGALATLAATVGRGAKSRRWVLDLGGGRDQRVPSMGHDVLYLNALPS